MKDFDLMLDVDAGYFQQTVRCPWCNGTGELRQAMGYPKECRWCHGTGVVDPEEEPKPPEDEQP